MQLVRPAPRADGEKKDLLFQEVSYVGVCLSTLEPSACEFDPENEMDDVPGEDRVGVIVNHVDAQQGDGRNALRHSALLFGWL